MYKGTLFSTPLPTLVIYLFLIITISLWFWFAFPWWLVLLSTFSHTIGLLYAFFWEVSAQVLTLFFNWVLWDFFYWVVGVICIFWKLTPYQIYGLQIFSSFCRLSFHSVDYFLCCEKLLVWCSPTCLLLVLSSVLLVSHQWNHCQDQYHEAFILCFLLGVLKF